MTIFIRKSTHRWVALLMVLTVAATSLLQIANIKPAFAAYTNTYPWDSAPCAASGSNLGKTSGSGYWCSGYNWGETPCPSGDGFCTTNWLMNGYYLLDQWGEGFRNCVSYTAWQLNQVFHVNITSSNSSGWGNGKDWNNSALAAGYTDDTSPQAGDIAQWDATSQNTFGHVAYVYAVNGTTASYAEYNYARDGAYLDTYTNASGSQGAPTHWIHIGTLSNTSALTPASISFNGALNVFKIGGDNNLYQNYWNGHTWNGWTNIGGSFVSNPAVIVNGSALNIFERGLDGQVYTEYNSGSGWSGWTSLGSHQMKGNPTVMFYGTSMNVFALDTTGVPYEDTQDSSGHWTGWGSNTNNMASDPAAVSYGGKLHLIYRGGDNKPYENVFGSSGWSGFSEIGQYASVSGNPSALSYSAESELDVYFNTSVNQIWKDTNSGSGWGSWTQMGSSFVSDPEIMAYNNDLQIFARDTSNNIETRYWSYSGQSWSSWTSLGGSSNNLASDPFAYQNGSSELDVYASDGSANAYEDTKITPNNWGGFSKLN